MKITLIHGQNHKGSTYHIARMLAEKLQGDITEFFLPRDFSAFCVGCTNCFEKSETLCPHYNQLTPITRALNDADVIILTSPVYVMHATAAMKALLDHYGYRFMAHRPEESMFRKQAVCISTAAGAGTGSTNKDMTDSTFFWGVGKTYRYGISVQASSWNGVSDKKKIRIQKDIFALAKKIGRQHGRVKPSLKTKFMFMVMRQMHKNGFTEADRIYWEAKGWLGKKRPWN